MKNFSSTILLRLILVSALVTIHCTRCEQLSTVFVLETSDSDSSNHPVVSNNEESSSQAAALKSDDANTHVITDDFSSSSSSANNNKSNNKNQPHQQSDPNSSSSHNEHQSHSSSNHNNYSNQHSQQHNTNNQKSQDDHSAAGSSLHNSQDNHNNNDHETHANLEQSQSNENKSRDNNNGRRLDEGYPSRNSNTVTRGANNNNNNSSNQQQSSSNPRTRSTSPTSTTTAPYHDRNYSSTRPKSEERLLISITSGDDDSYNKQPHKVSSNGHEHGSGHDDHESAPSQQHHQKPKPSITISIQDANIHKQTGGSGGSSAVIVRPGEDGQSIVISTVGQKPTIITPSSSNSNSHGGSNGAGSHNEPPYREPVNNPIAGIVHQHLPTTTRRPNQALVNDYQPSSGNVVTNRPITSTLIEQPRPPIQVINEERPPRPVSNEESNYDQQRPTPRPVNRPITSDYNNNQPLDQYDTRPTSNEPGSSQASNEYPKYPLNEKGCGIMHETRIVGGDEADPDDFLWMAAVIKSRPKDGEAKPFCGGSLITRRHILTAAHCLEGLAPRDVLVRLGSYDFDDSTASSLSADFAIDQFRVPAQYSKKTHVADIAIMRLKTPLSLTDNYKTVCMPQARRSYVGALGTVTGYGSQSQTFRRAAPKLRQVTVPIWENRKCSVVYKRNLTDSFLCAGYDEGGKDACQGDSGGPLMTEGPNERMMIVGVVSHGIGCGAPGYPGVYTRTTTYLDWIEKNTKE